MARKFKVGDKVRVIAHLGNDPRKKVECPIGLSGEINKVSEYYCLYPYGVIFDGDNKDIVVGWWFTEKELELIVEENESILTFELLLKQIKSHLLSPDEFKVEIFTDTIAFCLYDDKLVIQYTLSYGGEELYIDSEMIRCNLNLVRIVELNWVMELLNNNKNVLKELLSE